MYMHANILDSTGRTHTHRQRDANIISGIFIWLHQHKRRTGSDLIKISLCVVHLLLSAFRSLSSLTVLFRFVSFRSDFTLRQLDNCFCVNTFGWRYLAYCLQRRPLRQANTMPTFCCCCRCWLTPLAFYGPDFAGPFLAFLQLSRSSS